VTEILLIRHGETAWNAIRRLQGHLDVPLNAEGEHQAAALAQSLRDEPLDAIFASDLQRARQTAQPLAQACGMALQLEPGLRERCYGAFEGMMYADIEQHYPEAHAAWQAREIDARFPPGVHVAETLREFSDRVLATVTRLASGNYRKLALVTHGGVLECVYRAARSLGLDHARDFDIFNASINRFRWDGSRFELLRWGDVSHMERLDLGTLDEVERV
jgi:probable phosphoglycerate mutase